MGSKQAEKVSRENPIKGELKAVFRFLPLSYAPKNFRLSF